MSLDQEAGKESTSRIFALTKMNRPSVEFNLCDLNTIRVPNDEEGSKLEETFYEYFTHSSNTKITIKDIISDPTNLHIQVEHLPPDVPQKKFVIAGRIAVLTTEYTDERISDNIGRGQRFEEERYLREELRGGSLTCSELVTEVDQYLRARLRNLPVDITRVDWNGAFLRVHLRFEPSITSFEEGFSRYRYSLPVSLRGLTFLYYDCEAASNQ